MKTPSNRNLSKYVIINQLNYEGVSMLAMNQEELFKNIDAFDKAWIKELNRRKEDLENGNVTTVSGDEVFRKIQQKFKK